MSLLQILLTSLMLLIFYQTTTASSALLTQGFSPVTLDNSNFIIQKPYNIPINQRYIFANGVHQFWIYPSDKPFTNETSTQPRTEIRISVSLIYMIKLVKFY